MRCVAAAYMRMISVRKFIRIQHTAAHMRVHIIFDIRRTLIYCIYIYRNPTLCAPASLNLYVTRRCRCRRRRVIVAARILKSHLLCAAAAAPSRVCSIYKRHTTIEFIYTVCISFNVVRIVKKYIKDIKIRVHTHTHIRDMWHPPMTFVVFFFVTPSEKKMP